MAVTQYIGARYVPLFAEPLTWDVTKEYEPLTIVYYQGNSYTSKQAVPAGIELSNESFWAITGNYNAQVEQYRQEVRTFDGRITQNTSDIADNTSAISTNATAISDETTARTAADLTETTAREAADRELSSDITAEETARIAADSALSADISSLNTTLSDAIDAEETARIAADTALDTKFEGLIDDEETARIAADNALNDRIDSVRNSFNVGLGKFVAPTYVGDFMENRQFGSCCKNGDVIYTASPDNWDNAGVVRAFSLSTNTLVNTYNNVQMGHGNSMCYDSVRNRFWIAPIFTYNSGAETTVNAVYYYDTSFSSSTIMSMAHTIFAITFDHKTDTLYAVGEHDSAIKIYSMGSSDSEFSLFKTIPLSVFVAAGHVAPWQDVAIYDSVGYFIHPDGTMYLVKLDEDTPYIFDTCLVGAIDSQGYWRYGEVEGIEFSADGLLYNARNAPCGLTKSGFHHPVNCCFVTYINTKEKAPVSTHNIQGLHGTFSITQSARNKFTLGRTELRSLAQVNWLLDSPGTISIPSGENITEDIPIRLSVLHGALSFNVDGNYTTQYIEYDGGIFGIFISDSGRLTFTANREAIYFYNNRVVDFRFRNRGTVSYAGNSFTRVGYANVNTSVLQMNNPSSMTFGSNVSVTQIPTFMIGNAKVTG